ncbi:MAG: hypothetical protein RJB66_730 [Pseudomonadota bacterium]
MLRQGVFQKLICIVGLMVGCLVQPLSAAEKESEKQNQSPPKEASGRLPVSSVIQESTTVKAIKKRGGSVVGEGSSDDAPASLIEDEKSFLAGLDYPELQVVPKASERLLMEQQEGRNSFIGNYWPVQISALALMVAGSRAAGQYTEDSPSSSQQKENQFASQMGILFGGMWLGATAYLDYSMSYGKSLSEIKKVNGKDKKSLLLKERLSEEALERPAKVARMINNFSVWSTFTLAIYINSQSKQELPNYAAVAMGLSFLPWLIENRLIENWDKHQEYKRKIYAPLTQINFMVDPTTGRATPLLGMQWRF